MEVWIVCAFVLLLSPCSRAQDTVAEDIGTHQLERLVKLLTLKECEDLVVALSSPEEDIFKRLERLAPENNQLRLQPLNKRALLSSAQEIEDECRKALTDWLVENGKEIYYDRLTRALQHIGRTDVAVEVGKNINQDMSLSLRRYVEDYHKIVSSFSVPEEPAQATNKRVRRIKVSDLSEKDLDVIVERAPVPPYSKGPLDGLGPLLWSILLGFCVTGLVIFCPIMYLLNARQVSLAMDDV
ncbi:hypothetical protein NL108_016969 [Boleophthalmus pectinirostris]|uniref:transmembrane and death domain protein 1-like n=1 Tax=Boleophthalmus pectinirostris TaxID=150288 RepID=UPI00242BD1F4|nr:transmembrane and death domain protein 1-like [Boleophthalmus pectinirostris]KAJ0064855.1 hypothetical protein NL108_016969 [Boleophthalmus pectinirostris]